MAVSLAGFLERHPEFADDRAPTAQVEAAIAEATRRVSALAWGATTDDGISFLAAHLLATSPWGQQANLVSDENLSTYGETHAAMAKVAACGLGKSTGVLDEVD